MIYIGIDPGITGGIAWLNDDGTISRALPMPPTDRDLLDALSEVDRRRGARAVLERVWSSPQMGVASAFTFGRSYGALRMALSAARIPFDEVTPAKWQGPMGVLQPGRAQGKKDKNISKRRAQQLFPTLTVTHAIADALLLAEFCRRLERGIRREERFDGKEKVGAQTHPQAQAQELREGGVASPRTLGSTAITTVARHGGSCDQAARGRRTALRRDP